jgi:hypothetical protein
MTPAPIVIVAAPFSGSSWLAGVLGTQPELYAVPQLCAFMADRVGELLEIFEIGQDEHGDALHRTIAELYFGGQQTAQINEARAWLAARSGRRVCELLDELADVVAPRRLVIPETEAPLRPIQSRRMRQWRADTQFVHLHRHPWTQGCRFAAWLQDRLFVPIDYRDYSRYPPLPDPQIPWLRANEMLDRLFAEVPDTNVMRLASEDFDRDFDAAFARLAGFLGIDGETAAARNPSTWRYVARGPSEAPGGLEADVWAPWSDDVERFARAPQLDAPLPWRPDGRGFDAAVIALAQRYGYR